MILNIHMLTFMKIRIKNQLKMKKRFKYGQIFNDLFDCDIIYL